MSACLSANEKRGGPIPARRTQRKVLVLVSDAAAKLLRSAILEIFPRPRPSGQVDLTFVDDAGTVGDVNHVPRAPVVFAATFIGARTDTGKLLAVVQVSDPTRTEGPVFGTTDVGSRAEDCSEPRRRPFPIHLVKNASRWPRTVGDGDGLE